MQELFVIPEVLPLHLRFSLINLRSLVLRMSKEQLLDFAGPVCLQNQVRERALVAIEAHGAALDLIPTADELLSVARLELEIREAGLERAKLLFWATVVEHHLLEKKYSERLRLHQHAEGSD